MLKSGGLQFKICLLGDGFVGKTSLRRMYLDSMFRASYIPTLGTDFAQKISEFDGTPVHLIIWDIAGQPLYQGLRKRYYEGASGLIMVYSVESRSSFQNALTWLEEARGFMRNLPPVMIVANKIDLREDEYRDDVVTTEEGLSFSEDYSKRTGTHCSFFETSALTGENVEAVFDTLVREMVTRSKSKKSHGGQI